MYVSFDSGDKLDIQKRLNKWVSNGWDLTKKFIKISGGGSTNWYTIFYDSCLDSENKVNVSNPPII